MSRLGIASVIFISVLLVFIGVQSLNVLVSNKGVVDQAVGDRAGDAAEKVHDLRVELDRLCADYPGVCD